MKYKAAIFDLDGTLLDTLDDLWDAVNHTMDMYGFPRRTRDEVRSFVGNGVERLIELSVPDGLNNPKFTEAVASYRAYYAANSEHKTAPYAGVTGLIRKLLSDGIAVSVVSNKPHGSTVTLCAKYFPDIAVVCGEREAEGIRRKPYPDTVFKAVGKKLITSVPFITYMVMLVMATFSIPTPSPILTFTEIVGSANSFMAMLMLGVGFELKLEKRYLSKIGTALLLRYTISAIFALCFYFLLPFSLEVRQVAAIVAFAPVSSASVPYTGKMNGDVGLAGAINSCSIVISLTVITVLLMVMGL